MLFKPRSSRAAAAFVVFVGLVAAPAAAQEAPCADGMASGYACSNVDLLARLPLNATPEFAESSSDVWGWTDPQTGLEYAIINQYDHTAFVDLSTPTAPFVVGRLAAPTEAVARDAKVYADHVFLSTDADLAPVQVFDLTRLRGVTAPPVDFTADASYTDGTDPHNLAINEASGFAYFVLTGSGVCDAGLHIVDVRTPTSPTYAGCFAYSGAEFHDLQCLTYDGPDPDYQGSEVCFGSASGDGAIVVVDVTDKAAPAMIAAAPYPDPRYTHQGWLTEDRRYFLADDELDEGFYEFNTRTLVFDVQDLDDPQFAFAYEHPTTSTDHNLFVRGDYVYQANYTSGLRILDLSEIDGGVLTEVAFFDTHPEDDAVGFDGAFGVYPYFESGIVVVSDMARGLFVLRPTLGGAVGEEPPVLPSGRFSLSASPNPFTDGTRLTLDVDHTQHVTVAVYDVLGRRVADLFEGTLTAADDPHPFSFDAAGLPAGTYVVRAVGEQASVSRVVTRSR